MMDNKGELSESRVMQIAASQGLDTSRLAKAIQDPEIDGALLRNMELAKALDINGTPAFVIGGQVVPGAIGADGLKKLIAEARLKGS